MEINKALVILNEKRPALLDAQTKLHISVIKECHYHYECSTSKDSPL